MAPAAPEFFDCRCSPPLHYLVAVRVADTIRGGRGFLCASERAVLTSLRASALSSHSLGASSIVDLAFYFAAIQYLVHFALFPLGVRVVSLLMV